MSPCPPSMITQQQVLDRFRRLFVCRDDCYHRYDDGGRKWERINGPISDEAILAHLTRRECIALAPVKQFALIWAAIEFTAEIVFTKKTLQDDVLNTLEKLDQCGIGGHIVEIANGYQVWVFLEEPCSAKATEVLLHRLTVGEHVVHAGQGPIGLPLGVDHDDRDVFCGFLNGFFAPVENQRDYLVHMITPTSTDVLQEAYEGRERSEG